MKLILKPFSQIKRRVKKLPSSLQKLYATLLVLISPNSEKIRKLILFIEQEHILPRAVSSGLSKL